MKDLRAECPWQPASIFIAASLVLRMASSSVAPCLGFPGFEGNLVSWALEAIRVAVVAPAGAALPHPAFEKFTVLVMKRNLELRTSLLRFMICGSIRRCECSVVRVT